MNNLDMASMNAGNPVGGMHMMHNNMQNGAMPRQQQQQQQQQQEQQQQQQGEQQPQQSENGKLNTWIYSYLMEQKQYDVARMLKSSTLSFNPPIGNGEDEVNGVVEDSKHGVLDKQKPADLPAIKAGIDQDGASLLSGWFAVFWDTWCAHTKRADASKAATQLMEQNRMRGQGRGDQFLRMNGMMPNHMDPKFSQQMMRMNGGDLRQTVLQNQQNNGFRVNNPAQMAALQQRNAMLQQQSQQQNMRRDPSGMEMNGQRPHTPSSGDHAPSPKRARMDGAGFNPTQMMPNGRPPPGMPPQMMNDNSQAQSANALLVANGINPANLSESQFASFQSQQPSVQQKSVEVYAQNMSKGQRDNAMGMPGAAGGPEFYNGNPQMMRPGAMGPNPGGNGQPGNHALQDYQMQLMLLEQQNKKRLLMARQEQDVPTNVGFAPNMSPSGSRGGPSPGPGEGGSMRGSPAAMNNFASVQPPDLFAQMGGAAVRGPPSSNPAFNGQFNPQMQQMRQDVAGRMPNGNWQTPAGQMPMNQQNPMSQQQQQPQQQQPNQPQSQQQQQNQHPQLGTPQQRNAMPPPQAPPSGAANGRTGAEDAPPTPQQTNKANPKTKKDSKKTKGEGKAKKNSNSVAATPASEADNPPPTPTPSTPITPSHPNSFNQKDPPQATSNQANGNANVQIPVPAQDINVQQFNANGGSEEVDPNYGAFNDMPDQLLDNFNFEEFLDNSAFDLLANVDLPDVVDSAMADGQMISR